MRCPLDKPGCYKPFQNVRRTGRDKLSLPFCDLAQALKFVFVQLFHGRYACPLFWTTGHRGQCNYSRSGNRSENTHSTQVTGICSRITRIPGCSNERYRDLEQPFNIIDLAFVSEEQNDVILRLDYGFPVRKYQLVSADNGA